MFERVNPIEVDEATRRQLAKVQSVVAKFSDMLRAELAGESAGDRRRLALNAVAIVAAITLAGGSAAEAELFAGIVERQREAAEAAQRSSAASSGGAAAGATIFGGAS